MKRYYGKSVTRDNDNTVKISSTQNDDGKTRTLK